MGHLDVLVLFAQKCQAQLARGTCPVAIAAVPINLPDFAMDTSLSSLVAGCGVRLAHCLVVDKRRVALARERIEIAEALAHHELFMLAVGTLGESPEGALVVADG